MSSSRRTRESRPQPPRFLWVMRVRTPGVQERGRGCVGCSHGIDTGLGGASWGHMESGDEECAPGIEPLPAPYRVWGWGEAATVSRGVGYREITEPSFFFFFLSPAQPSTCLFLNFGPPSVALYLPWSLSYPSLGLYPPPSF